ncbi:MAG TPA: 23S rRNA (guanosine(2251)-2'-O)-methyltransferase RlmB [Vicinamibacterales bacterium]
MRIYGINPVLEGLRAGRVTALRVATRSDERLREIVRTAERQGVPVRHVEGNELDRVASHRPHQGVVADVKERESWSLEELVSGAHAAPLLVVLDGVEDPHNVGAILRTVDAAGADGVVRQTRHAARLDGAVAKASAGAVEHVRIADVVNVARALASLKELGVWTVGFDADAPTRYDSLDLTAPTAFVVGAEGVGLRRLVRDRCDWLVSIPMAGHVSSLNVSVAAGVALFEAVRQRFQSAGRPK